MEGLEQMAGTRLRAVGQRLTRNRRALLETLVDADRPLTLPEILASGRGFAQSSVYRNLQVLEQARVVRRYVDEGDFARYELSEDLTEHHHHLVCASCGAVQDVVVPAPLEQTMSRTAAELATAKGFEPRSHRLDVIGLCPRCA